MGPVCRDKYGYETAQAGADMPRALATVSRLRTPIESLSTALQTGDVVKACNIAVRQCAAMRTGHDVAVLCAMIHALGFVLLANTLITALDLPVINMSVDTTNKTVTVVNMPYLTPEKFTMFLAAIKTIPGRVYDKTTKQNRFPFARCRALTESLRSVFGEGTLVVGTMVNVL